MPSALLFVMFIQLRLTLAVLVSAMELPVVLWIVPPDPAEPVPLTLRPPVEPVVFRMIPLAGPEAAVPAVMVLKIRLPAPIVVFATFRAVPVVVVSVLLVSVVV